MFPEKDGFTAIDAAVKLFNNEAVPEHIVSPTAPMIGDDWKKYLSIMTAPRAPSNGTRSMPWCRRTKCMKTAADLKQ